MLGNSLNYLGYTPQRKIFDLKNYNIQNITNISLFFYQEQGSFYDDKDVLIPFKDSFKNNLPANIFVDNIKLSFGFFIDELNVGVDSVIISPAEGFSLSYDVEPENVIVNLNWLHWNDDNSKLLTKEEILKDSRYHIEWYKYQLYDDAIQAIKTQREKKIGEFQGVESEDRLDLIEMSLIDNLGCSHINNNNWQRIYKYDDNFSCELVLDGDASTQEQIRAFVYFTDSTTVSESNILTFEGENEANPKVTNKKQGAFLTLSDESNGEYYLYTEANILDHEDKKTRILTVSYYTADGEEVDLLEDTNYSIEWTGPDPEKKSMLTNCQPGNKKTEYVYSIASQYNPSALDNTITCKVIYSNEDQSFNNYVVEQSFMFGYANSANTDKQLTIDFKDKVLQYNNVSYSKNAIQSQSLNAEAFILKNVNTLGLDNEDQNIDWHLSFYPISSVGEKSVIRVNTITETELPDRTDTFQLINFNDKKEIVYLIPPNSGFNLDSYYLILCASVGGSTVEFPIPITANQYEYNYITGANYILYKQLGIPFYNKEPYCIFDHNGDQIDGQFTWEYIGDNWYSITNSENNKAQLVPSQVYLEQHGPVGVRCKKNEELIWCQPITVSESAFASTTLSSWDGKSVQVNDNSVTAPMIMAGKKEVDDQNNIKFTGVMMGDLQEDTEGALPLTGLYGFRKGNPSFGFKEDGTAFIGESGIGRIEFDGRHGWISSGDFICVNPLDADQNFIYDTTSFIDLTAEGQNIYINDSRTNYKKLIVKFGDNFLIEKNETNGVVTNNVTITGDLTATRLIAQSSGKIASFNIIRNWLYNVENSSSIFVGSEGIFLGATNLPQNITTNVLINNIVNETNYGANFYVTKNGYLFTKSGKIAGWNIGATAISKNDNSFYLSTATSGNSEIISVKFGANFLVGNQGTVNVKDLLIAGNLAITGSVNGLYKLASISIGYTIKKDYYYTSVTGKIDAKTLSGYIPVGIVRVASGNKWVKIQSFNINTVGEWYIGMTKHPYKAKVTSKAYMTFLLIKSSYCNVAKLTAIAPPDSLTDDRTGNAGTSGGSVGTFNTGNILSEDMNNSVEEKDESLDDDEIIEAYVRTNATAYSSNWLSLTENGNQIITPSNGITYLIVGTSDFSGQSYIWDSSISQYSLKQEIFNDFVFAGEGADAIQISDYLNLKSGITNIVNSSNIFKNTINFTRTASNIVNGVETGNNKTSFNFGNSGNNNDVLLTYNGREVATKGYVEDFLNDDVGTGASKNWVKKNFHALAASSTAEYHRLDMSLYALINSPDFSGTPTAPKPAKGTTSNRLATCDWVYNYYCETDGSTINSIKDKINDIIDEANLNVSKFTIS